MTGMQCSLRLGVLGVQSFTKLCFYQESNTKYWSSGHDTICVDHAMQDVMKSVREGPSAGCFRHLDKNNKVVVTPILSQGSSREIMLS